MRFLSRFCGGLWLVAAVGLVGCSESGDSGSAPNPIGAGANGGSGGSGGVGGAAGAGGTGGTAGTAGAAPVGGAGAGGAGGMAGTGGIAGMAGMAGMAGAAGTTGMAGGGAGGASGVGGMAGGGAGGEAGGPAVVRKPPCLESPSQVVVVGDSYINYTEQLNPDIAARAVADGALQAGQEYRLYAVPGSSMASGGIAGFIPDQFTLAVNDDPNIIATIMTGGGNDLLIPDAFLGGAGCLENADAPSDTNCTNIVTLAIDKAKELMITAANAGVHDVVYFFYPHLPGGGLGGTYPNVMLDYAYPRAQALCDDALETTGGKLACHFIDLRPIFEGKAWFQSDGVHPTAEGHDAMADEIWSVMKDNCIAQPASSGCCEP